MKISVLIGRNIKELMEKDNISNRKLAEVIGVSHPTISKYIKGTQVIDSEKLMKVAKFFNKSFEYFFTNEHSELKFLFRADKPKQDLNRIDFSEVNKKVLNYIDIVGKTKFNYIPREYKITIEGKKLSIEEESIIEKVAYEQRRFFNIEHIVPDNYYSVVEQSGINVIATKFNNESFFGASSYSSEFGSFIIINCHELIPEERQIFSLFHELGHLLLNRSDYKEADFDPFYENSRSDINEKIVNKFAGYFLLPRYLVLDYIKSKNRNVDIIEMKKYFKVSIQALYMALYSYDIISKEQYTEFWKKLNLNGWKKIEPSPLKKRSYEEKNQRWMSCMKELYKNDEISLNKISEILEYDLITTRKLLKRWSDVDEQYLHLS